MSPLRATFKPSEDTRIIREGCGMDKSQETTPQFLESFHSRVT